MRAGMKRVHWASTAGGQQGGWLGPIVLGLQYTRC